MPAAPPDSKLVERFRRDLAVLTCADRLAVAVSGGPDSLALLLLAHAALPGRVAAATVDHGLRPEAAGEAVLVGTICAALGVPHDVLRVESCSGGGGVQAAARRARYAALQQFCRERGLPALATAHHADDQAETVLMRLARGAGLGGLAGVRAERPVDGGAIVRPLLGWRKAELAGIVAAAGLTAVDDPANADPRHDRTAFRALLAGTDALDAARLAASAGHLAEAEAALEWSADRLWGERASEGEAVTLDLAGLPAELARRLMRRAFAVLGAPDPRGPDLARLMATLTGGGSATLAGLKAEPGPPVRLAPAPPRRSIAINARTPTFRAQAIPPESRTR